jgi:hypothetical protein
MKAVYQIHTRQSRLYDREEEHTVSVEIVHQMFKIHRAKATENDKKTDG